MIEKDAALERRFQQVYVGEPSVEDTVAIRGVEAGEQDQRQRDGANGIHMVFFFCLWLLVVSELWHISVVVGGNCPETVGVN